MKLILIIFLYEVCFFSIDGLFFAFDVAFMSCYRPFFAAKKTCITVTELCPLQKSVSCIYSEVLLEIVVVDLPFCDFGTATLMKHPSQVLILAVWQSFIGVLFRCE